MAKFYNDYHGRARCDATPDNREWRQDIKSKTIRLILDTAEEMQTERLNENRANGGDIHEPLDILLIVKGLRRRLEAITA